MGVQKWTGVIQPDRMVASLSLAEQVVVWGLRRYRAARAGLAPLAEMFERIFQSEAPGALETFARLVRALERLPREPEAGFLSQELSRIETGLLALMAALHDGDRHMAAGIAGELAGTRAGAELVAAAAAFARALAEAGLPLGGPDRAEPTRSPVRSSNGNLLPPALMTADLAAGELLVLHAVRLWVVSIRVQRCSYERIARHFAEHGVPDAAPSLHAILHQTSVAAARQVDVRCPSCRLLSPDEARLIHAVACAQAADRPEAFTALSAWLPLAAARLTLESIIGLADALRRAEVQLPRRGWDFDRLERLTAAAVAEPDPATCTIH